MYVYVGQDPFLMSKTLPLRNFGNQPITLKYRKDTRSVEEEKNVSEVCEGSQIEEEESNVEIKILPREKRVKERDIAYVQEKVQEWRRYYE